MEQAKVVGKISLPSDSNVKKKRKKSFRRGIIADTSAETLKYWAGMKKAGKLQKGTLEHAVLTLHGVPGITIDKEKAVIERKTNTLSLNQLAAFDFLVNHYKFKVV